MSDPNIRTDVDADGILTAHIDMPGRTMNVFSADMMDSLEGLITRVESDASVYGVVIASGKTAFIAGADLSMIRMFTERARTGTTSELHDLFGRLGRLFRRLELSRKPYIAAINGLALGGGLEVSLACHERVATDDAKLGLPEIKLGLLPGAGGTQRLPRLIGTSKGLQMLLTGEPATSREALEIGLVDEVVTSDALIAAAKRRAKALQTPVARWDRPDFSPSSAPFDFSNAASAHEAIAKQLEISDYQLRHYPAYHAIIDCVVGGWSLPMTEAGTREMDIFVELMRDPVAGNMVRTLFLNRQSAVKSGALKPDSPYASGPDALVPRARSAKEKAKALAASEQELSLAVALAALRVWADGKIDAPEIADVVVVNDGLMPSYTGGPFTWLRQHGGAEIQRIAATARTRDIELFDVPASALDNFLASD